MNRKTFQAACSALWGPQYRSEAARVLGVHLRTLMRWDKGDTKIPATAAQHLVGLLINRDDEIRR